MATVATVISQVKWATDRQLGGRLTDANLLSVATRIYREAWEVIITANRDRYVKTSNNPTATRTLTGGAASNSITIAETDFYDLYTGERSAVQLQSGDDWLDVPPHRRESSRLGYRFETDVIYIEPLADAAGVYRYRYVYKPADLVATTDTIVDFHGWVEALLVDGLVVRCKMRDEEDPALLPALIQRFESKVQAFAAQRHAPRRVIDVRSQRRRPEDVDY